MEIKLTRKEIECLDFCVEDSASMFRERSRIVNIENESCLSFEQEKIVNMLPDEMQEKIKKDLLEENSWASKAIKRRFELAEKIRKSSEVVIYEKKDTTAGKQIASK